MQSLQRTEAIKKHRLTQSNKLYGRNHENFVQIRRTIEEIIGIQFDTTKNVINLNTKSFNKDVLNFYTKISNFLPMQKYFNKTNFFNEINGFYRRIKLKAHFEDQTNKPKIDEDICRKPTYKT